MAKQNQADIAAFPVPQWAAPSQRPQAARASSASVQAHVVQSREEPAVADGFHVGRNHQHLVPAFNLSIDFTDDVVVPAGKRAVIEFMTATISVPDGEAVHLRMRTSLGSTAYDTDLCLATQGQTSGRQILVAADCGPVYSDYLLEFNIGRDNTQTEGDAFIAVSGYFANAWP